MTALERVRREIKSDEPDRLGRVCAARKGPLPGRWPAEQIRLISEDGGRTWRRIAMD